MSDYNGWTNYPTWAVQLWLANDQGLYDQTCELVAAARETHALPTIGPSTSPRGSVADALKTWVSDDLAPDLGASFAADLLGYALDQVNWLEIADAWIETALEVQP